MGPARIRNARVKSMCVSPPFLMSSSTHIRKGGLGLTNSVSSSVCCGFKPLVSFESGSEEDTEAGICFLPTEGFFSFSGTLSFSSPLSSNKAAMNADLRDAGHGIPPDECLTGKNAPSDQMCWSLSCAIITYLLFSARQYRYVYDCFTYLTTRTKNDNSHSSLNYLPQALALEHSVHHATNRVHEFNSPASNGAAACGIARQKRSGEVGSHPTHTRQGSIPIRPFKGL